MSEFALPNEEMYSTSSLSSAAKLGESVLLDKIRTISTFLFSDYPKLSDYPLFYSLQYNVLWCALYDVRRARRGCTIAVSCDTQMTRYLNLFAINLAWLIKRMYRRIICKMVAELQPSRNGRKCVEWRGRGK